MSLFNFKALRLFKLRDEICQNKNEINVYD